MQVPSFLLRRLYVKGSLRNEDGGFAFDLRNTLGSGYADQVLPLRVDGEDVPPESCTFRVDGATLRFTDITAERPMTLAMERTLAVHAAGTTLSTGAHTVEMAFVVTGMGEMRFEVQDSIADG